MVDITIRELSQEEYATILEQVPHSAFHRPAWLDVIARVYKLRIRLLGYMRDSQLCAVTPLMGRRIGPLMLWGAPLRKCGTPPATPFCSPAEEAFALLPAFRLWCAKQHFGYLQVTLPAKNEVQTTASERIEPLDNLELDLKQPLEELWKSLSELPRRCVRKAVRAGVTVHWRHGSAFLPIQESLLHDTYARQGLDPNFPIALYREILEKQRATNLHLLVAQRSRHIVSAIWAFKDGQTCYYWDAASMAEGRDLNANHLLVWCLIRWAHRQGLRTLDFVGTSVGGRGGSRPGIGRFKQSMGGRPVQYSILYHFSSLTRAAFCGYRWLTRLRLSLTRRTRHESST